MSRPAYPSQFPLPVPSLFKRANRSLSLARAAAGRVTQVKEMRQKYNQRDRAPLAVSEKPR
jgi:hypothetical protein